MPTRFRATKTRSNRPGWSVTFRHPVRHDSRGKPGLKVRRGLGTSNDTEAEELTEQLNQLLENEAWWSSDRRQEAEAIFAPVVVSAFFDGMEAGRTDSRTHRERLLPLPTKNDGYARVMLVGTTGAGKTTLLRHLIGSNHETDRFPSTSTAKTTTADIEIVVAPGSYRAAVTFMPEHEVRAHVDECLEEACVAAAEEQADAKIAGALLSHREQRFRLSYVLGQWQQEQPEAGRGNEDEFSFEDGPAEHAVDDDEAVPSAEIARNREKLEHYVARIRSISADAGAVMAEAFKPLKEQASPEEKAVWLELFVDSLYDSEEFPRLAVDIMEDVEDRFALINAGEFQKTPSGWPILWTFEEADRGRFLRQVRWFSSNHHKQFGRLLTPLVDGMRIAGDLRPAQPALRDAGKLVLIDGQGLGHTAKSASSVSTQVTSQFNEVDMILLVDNAEQPMQAAPIELLRSVGSSGHGDKLAIVFTHFDLVKGDNLSSFAQKRDHVMESVGNALSGLQSSIGVPVASVLERHLQNSSFFLGGLDRETQEIPTGFIKQMAALLQHMQEAARPEISVELAPVYSTDGLEIALRDAVEGFQGPWKARLGLRYHDGVGKEHWTRVKALSRRFGFMGKNEYNDLRPVADLVARLQENISRWLDNPAGWNREPEGDEERALSLAPIRKGIFKGLHILAQTRLSEQHLKEWRAAYQLSGKGSSYDRAEEIDSILGEAAPLPSSEMTSEARSFLLELLKLVKECVAENGGEIRSL